MFFHGIQLRGVCLHFLYSLLSIINTAKFPCAFFPFSSLNSSSCLSLSLYNRCSSLLITFVALHQYVHISVVLGSPELGPAVQLCPTGKDYLPHHADNGLPNVTQEAVDLLCHKSTSLAHSQLVRVTRTPGSFFAVVPSHLLAPSIYWCLPLFLHRCRTLHIPLLDFMRFLSDLFSSPSCPS